MSSKHIYPFRAAFSPSPPAYSPPTGNTESQDPLSPPLSQDLVSCALEFINNLTFGTIRLKLTDFSWAHFDTFEKELKYPRRISRKSADSLRYDYNPETLNLRLSGMPHEPHCEFEYFLSRSLSRNPILTDGELDQMHYGFSKHFILPYRATTQQVGQKVPAFRKQPDAFIRLRDRKSHKFSRVIFEIAFSQTYEEVRNDVKQWLERSNGKIALAVLIFLKEHRIPAPPDGDDHQSDDDNHQPDDDDHQSDDSGESNASMYEHLDETCDVDRHVGPISGFAELYRLESKVVTLVGDRINITSPPGMVSPDPSGQIVLSITDILPHLVGDNRVIIFDLAVYAEALEIAREEMALTRLVVGRQRRRKAAGMTDVIDADYEPGRD